jgi:hypothetical protein
MPKFIVTVREVRCFDLTIEAEDEESALLLASEAVMPDEPDRVEYDNDVSRVEG